MSGTFHSNKSLNIASHMAGSIKQGIGPSGQPWKHPLTPAMKGAFMCASSKFLGHIYARDGHGAPRLILAHQSFDEITTPYGMAIKPGDLFFLTPDHLKVNWLNERQFEIEDTGEILTRIPFEITE
ncbi:MAG: hypothetical protein RR283_06915 [Comamonas sp.]